MRSDVLYKRDVVPFHHDASQMLPGVQFGVVLLGFVQHEVHVLIEADDVPFDAEVYVLVQPHLDPRPVLQVSEDQVDGLHHHLLHFRGSFVRHFRVF